MMYIALKHAHVAGAIASLVLTITWAVVAWRVSPANGATPSRTAAALYVAHRVAGGLAGLTGVLVTFVGPWRTMLFPYIGLAAFVVHGFAAAASKHDDHRARPARRRSALIVQISAIALAWLVMYAKPW